MRKVIAVFAASVVGVIVLAGCVTTSPREAAKSEPELSEDVYLANNIHAQDDGQYYTASYANWTDCGRHRIIPVNTPVAIRDWAKGFVILGMTEDKRTVYVEFDPTHMDMDKEKYIDTITTSKKVDLGELSEVDQEGIEKGKAKVGMTKDGIRMALGYPAEHETPSLDDDIWTYWTNRWGTYDVIFNEDGEVTEIRN